MTEDEKPVPAWQTNAHTERLRTIMTVRDDLFQLSIMGFPDTVTPTDSADQTRPPDSAQPLQAEPPAATSQQ